MVLRDLDQEALRNVACALGARLVGYPEGLDNWSIRDIKKRNHELSNSPILEFIVLQNVFKM